MTEKHQTSLQHATPCNACGEKRQCVQWSADRWGRRVLGWQLCAVCLVEALRLVLSKNLKRRKPPAAAAGKTTKGGTK
jgi:hypothetical protein